VLSQIIQAPPVEETNTNVQSSSAVQSSEAKKTNIQTNRIAEIKLLPGQLQWQKPIPIKIESAYKEPAEPVIFMGKIFISKGNKLYIITVEGKLQKSIAVVDEGVKLTRPSVSDGIVYVGSDNGGIYAYSVDGEMLWKKEAGSEKYGASPTAGYGIVAVPSIEKGIMIFDKDGNLVVQIESDSVYSAPLLLDNGKTLVYATESGNIISYNIENKTQNWSKGYNERFLYPLVGRDVIFALVRTSGKVIAVNPDDGSMLWSSAFPEIQKTRINPVYADGELVLASNDNGSAVIIVDAKSGKVLNRASFENEVIATPYVTDRYIYIGTESGNIYSYNLSLKKYDWTFKSSGNPISVVVCDKNNVYALSADGMLNIVK
jgi:outer membrane protein assembly factor BamB